MNYSAICITVLLVLLLFSSKVCGQVEGIPQTQIPSDTLSKKQSKKLARQAGIESLRASHRRFSFRFTYVYAFLDTKVSFELPQGNLSSNLSLEQNLGLPSNSFFLTSSFVYRITPISGVYAHYYGIYRSEKSQTDRDYIFKNDSILAGSNIKTHFNTQVVSIGYLLSLVREPNAFLGMYFNVYLMFIETGVQSDIDNINSNAHLVAPMPNIGLLASFRLYKWLNLNAGIGFFSLRTSSFDGSLHNFNLSLMGRPVDWLGVSISYQEFDVAMAFPSDDINSVVEYNFRGPAVGISFIF